jgi:hypothetical protein
MPVRACRHSTRRPTSPAVRYAVVADGPHGLLARARLAWPNHWMLNFAGEAGALVRTGRRYDASSAAQLDALAEIARLIPLRTVPGEAPVRAGVDIHPPHTPSTGARLRAQGGVGGTRRVRRCRVVRPSRPS